MFLPEVKSSHFKISAFDVSTRETYDISNIYKSVYADIKLSTVTKNSCLNEFVKEFTDRVNKREQINSVCSCIGVTRGAILEGTTTLGSSHDSFYLSEVECSRCLYLTL